MKRIAALCFLIVFTVRGYTVDPVSQPAYIASDAPGSYPRMIEPSQFELEKKIEAAVNGFCLRISVHNLPLGVYSENHVEAWTTSCKDHTPIKADVIRIGWRFGQARMQEKTCVGVAYCEYSQKNYFSIVQVGLAPIVTCAVASAAHKGQGRLETTTQPDCPYPE